MPAIQELMRRRNFVPRLGEALPDGGFASASSRLAGLCERLLPEIRGCWKGRKDKGESKALVVEAEGRGRLACDARKEAFPSHAKRLFESLQICKTEIRKVTRAETQTDVRVGERVENVLVGVLAEVLLYLLEYLERGKSSDRGMGEGREALSEEVT